MPKAVRLHAGVGDAHHVFDALACEFQGNWKIARFGHAGGALGPALRRTRMSSAVTSRLSSSMRWVRSSMLSKTTAAGRCDA